MGPVLGLLRPPRKGERPGGVLPRLSGLLRDYRRLRHALIEEVSIGSLIIIPLRHHANLFKELYFYSD